MLLSTFSIRQRANLLTSGLLVLIGLGTIAPLGARLCAAEKVQSAKPAGDSVDRLISDLASQDYRTRESATRQLTAKGPTAIDALAKAAQTHDLEVSYRAVRILESLMESGDSATQDRIAESLKTMAGHETNTAAALATDVLALYQLTLNDRAIDQLRKLGAVVALSDELPLMEPGFVQITLTDGWKGTSDDLKLLKQVRNLQWLRVINVSLVDSDLVTIGELSQVMQVDLYGAGVSPEATEKLTAALPNSTIDRRNGALLGVSGLPNMPNCIINDVRPGTAAETAGIRIGDEIVSFDGKPVHNFEEFTGLVAGKKGGDEVKLELRREDQVISKNVALGRWTAEASAAGRFQPRIFNQQIIPVVPAMPQK